MARRKSIRPEQIAGAPQRREGFEVGADRERAFDQAIAAQASYAQQIPQSAAPGTCALRGEVCVAGDRIVRNVAFEVR